MKVKELIKKLKKFNQEAIVGTADYYGCCEEISSVSEGEKYENRILRDVILE